MLLDEIFSDSLMRYIILKRSNIVILQRREVSLVKLD